LKVLGISPLDKDATASLVEDGRLLAAAGEERFTRKKQQTGFPARAIQFVLESTGTRPDQVDRVVYPFLDWEQETRLMRECLARERGFLSDFDAGVVRGSITAALARIPPRQAAIHGLATPNQRMEKGPLKHAFYRLFGTTLPLSTHTSRFLSKRWARRASSDHRWWQARLAKGLDELGLGAKLERSEHHLSHAANAYLASGFERALVVTLDGYGSGLAGSISLGEGGRLSRLHGLRFPHSLGSLYEMVTSSLGFHPDRHAGKVVGLAAHGDPGVLSEVLLQRGRNSNGDLCLFENLNVYFSRYLAARFPMVDVAAAYQHALEVWAGSIVAHWLEATGCEHVVLSGGVSANVKMNQRIHELEGVKGIFIYPNMGDGGCGTGLALLRSWPGGAPAPIQHVYLGPAFGEGELLSALRAAGLEVERPAHPAAFVAQRLHAGEVVGRFDGAMEYGPRALGNRSVLYHGRDPAVNHWLNRHLGRTEFMPFAPVTLWEDRHRCYHGVAGAEHSAEFMTITFDCTDWMKARCPAAVHVDGTARPQLLRRETNPGYYDIIAEYQKLSGVPCLVNTSFNMHEEPIVCTPAEAVRAFLDGGLDGLSIGPFYARRPGQRPGEESALAGTAVGSRTEGRPG
jgi:carbamoyltransferase